MDVVRVSGLRKSVLGRRYRGRVILFYDERMSVLLAHARGRRRCRGRVILWRLVLVLVLVLRRLIPLKPRRREVPAS